MKRLLRGIENRRVDPAPTTTHTFGFGELSKAFELMESKEEGFIKPLIVFDDEKRTSVPPAAEGVAAQEGVPVRQRKDMQSHRLVTDGEDANPTETSEWIASLDHVLREQGQERTRYILSVLRENACRHGVEPPSAAVTPYVNTIPADREPVFPGDLKLEQRIKSIVRWNAMAMVVQANRELSGIGGHISTYASAATLFEVGFNHFFRARTDGFPGDMVYFQGHASPGVYARAYVEGRLSEQQLANFRRELEPRGGLPSYPHPWLMPDFWEFPTVSMGLSPIMGIYQARFNRYLENRGLREPSDARVWVLMGDGEVDEPESLAAINLAARDELDNLVFVINCNLQRLDGPVRGNGKIIQELEGIFRGAGWNVIKVVWGKDWDPLLASDAGDIVMRRMEEACDGDYQRYVTADASYIREHFFGRYPELKELTDGLSDEKITKLKRGGHDHEKVYAAYRAAVESDGRPTVILAKTIKGYGVGESAEGRNISHKQKKLNEEELRAFRSRFGIPISDEQVGEAPFYRPQDDSPEMQYLYKRRNELGGYVPARPADGYESLETPRLEDHRDLLEGSGDREVSTTMAFCRLLARLLRDKKIGSRIVPIVPDEARTFGMESLFRQCGIYNVHGQCYEPVDAEKMIRYRESKEGQMLEEGITEAGSMSSFIAAGTSYATHGVTMIPVYMFYSMFGFQRVGDLVWAAGDMRGKGFLIGGTSGRTTLSGEGLQHQDGHSHLLAATCPTIRSYMPAYAYEIAVIMLDGLKRLYHDHETAMYYLTIHNENHVMPAMPEAAEEGIIKGMYRFASRDAGDDAPRVQFFGSGSILAETLRAQELLADRYNVAGDVWSVTSYGELRRDALEVDRWNRLHGDQEPRRAFVEEQLADVEGPFVAATDFMRAVPEQIRQWVPGCYTVLGTDGFGRSDGRAALRRFFEVDAEHIALASLYRLAETDEFDRAALPEVAAELGIDPDRPAPMNS